MSYQDQVQQIMVFQFLKQDLQQKHQLCFKLLRKLTKAKYSTQISFPNDLQSTKYKIRIVFNKQFHPS